MKYDIDSSDSSDSISTVGSITTAVLFCTFETSEVDSKKVAIGSQFHLKRPLVALRLELQCG
jgi:hypothetical protein